MAQAVTLYRVLVASPADCDAERKLIPEVIRNWNTIHTGQTNAILEPVLWETHSTPEMGERPQGVINKQLGKISDVLVGTFWTRLGTHTGAAESGTAEEIEEFRRAGKPVLLYFSDLPAALSTVDQEQLKALVEYRKRLEAEGLVATYSSLADLRDQLCRHLNSTIGKVHAGPQPAAEPTAAKRAIERFKSEFEAFLRALETEWSSERDSEPYNIEEGRSIVRSGLSTLLNFRSQIEKDNSQMSQIIDDALRKLRVLQRYELMMDGGISFQNFWDEGTAVIESLKQIPPILTKIAAA